LTDQNSNHWLEKLAGQNTSPSYRAELPSPEAIAKRLRLWDLEKEAGDE
jgi:hypothetical protein